MILAFCRLCSKARSCLENSRKIAFAMSRSGRVTGSNAGVFGKILTCIAHQTGKPWWNPGACRIFLQRLARCSIMLAFTSVSPVHLVKCWRRLICFVHLEWVKFAPANSDWMSPRLLGFTGAMVLSDHVVSLVFPLPNWCCCGIGVCCCLHCWLAKDSTSCQSD